MASIDLTLIYLEKKHKPTKIALDVNSDWFYHKYNSVQGFIWGR